MATFNFWFKVINFYKPFFKTILKLKHFYSPNTKLLSLKKNKWSQVIIKYQIQLFVSKTKKFKLIDQNKLFIPSLTNSFSNYKNGFRSLINHKRDFNFYYLSIYKLQTSKIKNTKHYFVTSLLESRLDLVLIKSKFCLTLRFVKLILLRKRIVINNVKTKKKSQFLKSGDIVKMRFYATQYKKQLINTFKWFVPSKNLLINYKTKEIVVLGQNNRYSISCFMAPFYLNLKSLFYCVFIA